MILQNIWWWIFGYIPNDISPSIMFFQTRLKVFIKTAILVVSGNCALLLNPYAAGGYNLANTKWRKDA